MKLVRYGAPGREKPGMIDANGKIRDLSKVVDDIAGDAELAVDKDAKVSGELALIRLMTAVLGHRAQLLRSRRRSRHADPERADHLQ